MARADREPWLAPVRAWLDRSAADGQVIEFWWRDDDAVAPGPRLSRLFALGEAAEVSLAIAAIPAAVTPALLRACDSAGARVWQHGVAHHNHQPSGKKAELGDARPVEEIVAACRAARVRLEGNAFSPVMVPPWNRMREDLGPALAAAGYQGISRFKGSYRQGPPARVDTHIDPVEWHGTRSLVSPDVMADQVAAAAECTGPIGLLTHHAVHDDGVDGFVAAFSRLVRDHPGARWIGPDAALTGGERVGA